MSICFSCSGFLLTWFARPQDRGKELKLPESQVKAAAVQSYALYYGAPLPSAIIPLLLCRLVHAGTSM